MQEVTEKLDKTMRNTTCKRDLMYLYIEYCRAMEDDDLLTSSIKKPRGDLYSTCSTTVSLCDAKVIFVALVTSVSNCQNSAHVNKKKSTENKDKDEYPTEVRMEERS